MKARRGLIIYIPAAALLLATSANAANGRTFTCYESSESQWPMTQPQEHVDANYWPNWNDCLAWRNGDPGQTYVWSYGATSTPQATTTITAATTTTVPAETVPSSTTPEAPDTTPALSTSTTETPTTPPTTENPPTTTTYQTSSSVAAIPTNDTATEVQNMTTTSLGTPDTIAPTSTLETPTSPETVPPAPTVTPTPKNAVQGVTSDLAEGVTPEAARVVILSTIGTFMISAAPATQRKNARGKTTRGN